jgi:hypothetical protein
MSRNFSQLTTGPFCVKINFADELPILFEYEMLNFAKNRVETAGQLHRNESEFWMILEFDNLKPGIYQLTYQNIKRNIGYSEPCPSNFKIH